jgi:hypothetical protein
MKRKNWGKAVFISIFLLLLIYLVTCSFLAFLLLIFLLYNTGGGCNLKVKNIFTKLLHLTIVEDIDKLAISNTVLLQRINIPYN